MLNTTYNTPPANSNNSLMVGVLRMKAFREDWLNGISEGLAN
jgi:hypothetical protein